MALSDKALTTVSAVEGELELSSGTDTAYLERQIDSYSSLFIEATGRPWHRGDAYTEKVPSTGDPRLQVERRPVRSIDEIKVKGDTVDADEYAIEDEDAGIIRLKDDFWEPTGVAVRRVEAYTKYHEDRVEVTYDGGYVTPKQVDDGTFSSRDLPESIEMAVILTVANKYRGRGSPTNVDEESIGSASVSFATSGSGNSAQVMGHAVAPSFKSAVQRHKDRSVLR